MLNRAYSLLKVKSFDDDKRIIEGMATTPEPDRVGDIVEPLGAQFKNPSPLLWMHNHSLPVGTVIFGKPTKDGIPFKASLPRVEEPSQLKARIDEAWASVKAGLVAAVSIGFKAIEWSVIEDTGGYRFTKTELLELSLVTVPANSSATIQMVKSLDTETRAALGKTDSGKRLNTPAGATVKSVKLKSPKEGNTMNIAEQIKELQAARAAKVAEMESIMTKSAEAGETLDAAQDETYEALTVDVANIDKQLNRLETLKKAQDATVQMTPVKGITGQEGTESRTPSRAQVIERKVEPGVRLARMVKCIGMAKGVLPYAAELAANQYKHDPAIERVLKAAVAAGSTSNANWAGNLVGDETSIYADFIEYLRPQTIIGKFGANGVPSLRRVPFRVPLIGQTSGGNGYWTGEGKGKGLTKFDFSRTTLEPLKVANIAVLTEEVLRDSSPSAELIVRDQLVAALRERLDIDFVDPAKAASAGISPASITNGVSAIASSGTDEAAVRCDIKALFEAFIAANNAPTSGVFIMPSTIALALSLMVNPLGQPSFPGITMNGGTLWGLPVIVSEYVPTETAGAIVILVNAQDIYLGDDGGFQVDMSREASLQMDSEPTQNSIGTPTATQVVSLWQTNSVGFRAERTINWAKRRSSAVAVLDGVNWGACAS